MPNRTICDVLKEMRALDSTKNYSPLLSLVEEAQSLANRMEAALWDQKDLRSLENKAKELKEEIKRLREEKRKLGGKVAEYE